MYSRCRQGSESTNADSDLRANGPTTSIDSLFGTDGLLRVGPGCNGVAITVGSITDAQGTDRQNIERLRDRRAIEAKENAAPAWPAWRDQRFRIRVATSCQRQNRH